MMPHERKPETSRSLWTPLSRKALDVLLAGQAEIEIHLYVLYWLIWCSLLSEEDLLRLLSTEEGRCVMQTKAAFSEHLQAMEHIGLIERVVLHEPGRGRQERFSATDLGLYCYLSRVHSVPPLTMTRLVRSYPVERHDLTARLTRPELHRVLSELVTRVVAEGEPLGYHLVSYQQPWRHPFTVGGKRQVLASDAAFLIGQEQAATYAFLVYIDVDEKAERQVERLLLSLLDLRQTFVLHRLQWPALLILCEKERLSVWRQWHAESSVKRITRPLAGGLTTLDAMTQGIFRPIWYDLASLASFQQIAQAPRFPLSHLMREPALEDLVEHFSQQRRLLEILLKEAASLPARMKHRLTRFVGDSLQEEAAQVTKEELEAFFFARRKTRSSTYGTALLTLALSDQEKTILTWVGHHQLLDLLTLQALLHPGADQETIEQLRQAITHLMDLGLLETRRWATGPTPTAQERYLLTDIGLKYLATREDKPLSFYFQHPKYYKERDDEQTRRQWGTRGLVAQLPHTHGLYTFLGHLYRSIHRRGEVLLAWKSAHEAMLWYTDTISQISAQARPDAKLLFASSPGEPAVTILLEYDRGTTGAYEYTRKFRAYLDYQQASGKTLPLLLVVTPSHTSAQKMRSVLAALEGSLQVVIVLERDVLEYGLTLALRHGRTAKM